MGLRNRGIESDVFCRMLYWSDWSPVPGYAGIYRASIDNFYKEALITTRVTWPNALAIDFAGTCAVYIQLCQKVWQC